MFSASHYSTKMAFAQTSDKTVIVAAEAPAIFDLGEITYVADGAEPKCRLYSRLNWAGLL